MMSVRRMCRPLASSWTRPIEMPPTGSVMGTPASIRLSVAPQTEAIELDPLDSRMSEMTRIGVGERCRTGQDRSDGTLGQGAVADLAPAGPADRPNLADRERGHVVVEHELLAVLVHDAVDPLLVGGGAQHGRDQGLGLAALEKRRAVGAGQEADLALDRPQVARAAAVGPLAFENQLANDPLLDAVKAALIRPGVTGTSTGASPLSPT